MDVKQRWENVDVKSSRQSMFIAAIEYLGCDELSHNLIVFTFTGFSAHRRALINIS